MGKSLKRRASDSVDPHFLETTPKEFSVKSAKMDRISKMLNPYKVLLSFSFVVCAIQIFLGLSFFKTPAEIADVPSTHENSPDSQPLQSEYPCQLPPEALSAIKRASTEFCKDEIVQLSCNISKEQFYPKALPRYCNAVTNTSLEGKRLGCYKDSFNTRLLLGSMRKMKEDNSQQSCLSLCKKAGYIYAGLEYGIECFCGNSLPPTAKRVQDSQCNMPCSGKPDSTCGGYLAIDILWTGIQPLAPSKLGSEGRAASTAKVVFLLTVNGRALRQVLRVIQRLDGPNSLFYVHVDARQDYLHRELSQVSERMPNLRMAKSRYSTIWGGASLLTMLLNCMEELLKITDWHWDFVLNLSESDYPIRHRDELLEFLSSNKEHNFVKSHGRETRQFIAKQGLDKTFFQCENRMWRIGSRKLPQGIQLDGGSDWICLNREFAEYVATSEDELILGLKQIFNYTLLPAESFFHTVLQNSRFCRSYINNNLHLTNWKRKLGCKCQYKAVVDWCGCSPNDFLSNDWVKIEQTRHKQLFFARKFEPIVHGQILNRIDDSLNLTSLPHRQSYWQNVFDYRDTFPKPAEQFSTLVDSLASDYIRANMINYRLVKVVETTLFKFEDQLDSFLILAEVTNLLTGPPSRLELRVKMAENQVENRDGLLSLAVGTEFDPKELLFRNFLNNFGQESNLSARLEFGDGRADVYELAWFNPLGLLVATNRIKVNETNRVENLVPGLSKPLQPGSWSVVCVHQNKLLHSHRFLILPAVQPSPPAPDENQDGNVNSDQRARLSRHGDLSAPERERVRAGLDDLQAGRRGDWLTEHLGEFYAVVAACSLDLSQQEPLLAPPCEQQSWSSRFQNLAYP